VTTVHTQTVTTGDTAAVQQPVDDGRRYLLVGPRGSTTVRGSADLTRRVVEATRLGVGVAWQQLGQADNDSAEPRARW